MKGYQKERFLQPVERYLFFCNATHDATAPQSFMSGVNASFLGPLSPTNTNYPLQCDGTGVRSNLSPQGVMPASFLESHESLHLLKHHFSQVNATGLSFELWITPDTHDKPSVLNPSSAETNPVFTIAGKSSLLPPYNCDGYEVLLARRGPVLQLTYSVGDAFHSCRHLTTSSMSQRVSSALTHVIVSLSDRETTVAVNGIPFTAESQTDRFDLTLRHYGSHDTLQILPGPKPFQGVVHSFALYDTYISAAEAEARFVLGTDSDVPGPLARQLRAIPSSNYTLVQGRTSEGAIWLRGESVPKYTGPLSVEILSLPNHGFLFPLDEMRTLTVGSILELDRSTLRVPILYSSFSLDYFNAPPVSAKGANLRISPESFMFRVVAPHPETGINLMVSKPASQQIRVLNMNHRPVLTAPHRLVFESTSSYDGARTTISHISLADKDRNVDKVRVDLFVRNGTLSLDEHYLHLADFRSCLDRPFGTWECHGNTANVRSMTFLAVPEDVNFILRDMQYLSFPGISQDELVVRAYDGVGGECLAQFELSSFEDEFGNSYAPVQSGCHEVHASIEITVNRIVDQASSFYLAQFFFVCAALGLFLIVGLFLFRCCLSKMSRCRKTLAALAASTQVCSGCSSEE